MRRVLLTLAISAVAIIPAFTRGDHLLDRPACSNGLPDKWDDRLDRCPAPPDVGKSFERVEAKGLKVLGVASCASMACHHANEGHGKKGSEYGTWIAVDPHAKAFRTLYKPESKRMHEIMAAAFPNLAKYESADTNPLCLKCHGMGAEVAERFQGDGVGCERCHGPAEKWKTTHYLNDFDRQNTPGFVDTRCDQAARVYTCVKCHVGDASQEVDHVLIAAGHPRLRFEYGAYYANYPRHWADLGEKKRDPSYEAFSWGLGQLVTARAALELLISRATDPHKEANWPEFAEFDCTACHHDLSKVSPRQDRTLAEANKGIVPRMKKAGQLPWGTWYYPLLPTLKDHLAGAPEGLAENLAALDQIMRLRYPPQAEVQQQATKAIALLDAWITVQVKIHSKLGAGKPSFTDGQMKKLLNDLAFRTDIVQHGWDGGSQVYLGMAATNHALSDSDAQFAKTAPFRAPLGDVRVGLKHSFERGANTLYDTPNDYFVRLDSIFKGLNGLRLRK